MEQRGERWLEAEIYRLRGILLLQQSETSRRRWKPGYNAPWTSPVSSEPKHWSCGPPASEPPVAMPGQSVPPPEHS